MPCLNVRWYLSSTSGMRQKCRPSGWDASARAWQGSLQSFLPTRAIREYTENHYLPAASNYQERAAEDSKQGLVVLHWRQELDRHWNAVAFGAVRVETHDGQHFFQVEVSLGTLNPDQIRVELYANSNHGCKPAIESMNDVGTQCGLARNAHLFGSGFRNSRIKRLHGADHSSSRECFCSFGSWADSLATLIFDANPRQQALYHHADCNRAARPGEYSAEMEKR